MMEKTYYRITYKSNPSGIGHIIEKEGSSIKLLNGEMSLEDLGISFSRKNWSYLPVYNKPKKISPNFAKNFQFSKKVKLNKFLDSF